MKPVGEPLRSCARGLVLGAGLFVVASCDQMLGLSAPRLDPCVDGCFDGATPVDTSPVPDAASVPRPDPAGESTKTHIPGDGGPPPDASLPAVSAVRCGGGDLKCSGASQTCCAYDRSPQFDFVCISQTSLCGGTPVGCAKQTDCAAPFVCCDVFSTVACVTPGTCNGVLVCDPAASPSECPVGRTCRPSIDPQWPYYGCFE